MNNAEQQVEIMIVFNMYNELLCGRVDDAKYSAMFLFNSINLTAISQEIE